MSADSKIGVAELIEMMEYVATAADIADADARRRVLTVAIARQVDARSEGWRSAASFEARLRMQLGHDARAIALLKSVVGLEEQDYLSLPNIVHGDRDLKPRTA